MFTALWNKKSTFDPVLHQKLKEKCEKETQFGKIANFALWHIFYVVKFLKKIRQQMQKARYSLHSILMRKEISQNLFQTHQEHLSGISSQKNSNAILIIGEDSLSQCKRYRIDAKIKMLRELGFQVYFTSCWNTAHGVESYFNFVETILFYRVPLLDRWKELVAQAKKSGCKIIWEIDDLVFNPEVYAQHPYLQTCPEKERKQLLTGARLFRDFLSLADELIVSTEELKAEVLLLTNKPTAVVENALDIQLIEASSHVQKKPAEADQILIGYGSGTLTHDADLEGIASPLAELLAKYPHTRLVLFGHLKIPLNLATFGPRIQQIPFTSADKYFLLLSKLDICIAPLLKSRFNEVKSNIKFLEAAALGVPCIAAASGPFKKAIKNGINGFLADTEDEWRNALEALISKPELRESVAASARASVFAEYHPDIIRDTQLAQCIQPTKSDKIHPSHVTADSNNKKNRIAVVNVFFSPQSFGGATIVAEELATALAQKHHWEVGVFAGNTFDDLADYEIRAFENKGIHVCSVRLPRVTSEELEYKNEKMGEIFALFLDSFQPDVLHIHCVQHVSASILFEAKKRNIPMALTLHDAWWLCARQFRYIHEKTMNCAQVVQNPITCGQCFGRTLHRVERDQFLKKSLENIDLFLAPSKFQADLYIKNGLPPARVAVNENGVKKPNRARKRSARPTDGHVVFAHLGGPSAQKGYPMLKRAFENISSDNFTLRFTDSDLKLGIKTNLGANFRVSGRVEVVPPFSQEKIDDFFDGIDVLLAFSQWDECFGLVVREALARDVWVITSDAGGLPEAIQQGINGVVVPRHDLKSLQQAIEECLTNAERFAHHSNPHKNEIRTFDEQAHELHGKLQQMREQRTV